MIHARFYRDEKQGSLNMEVRGHAGAAPKGHDLVCAGASTLAYTLAQALRFLCENGRLEDVLVCAVSDGRADIRAVPKAAFEGDALCAFFTVQAGFYVLAANYPEYVSLHPMEA